MQRFKGNLTSELSRIFIYIILTVFSLSTFVPFLLAVIVSFSDEKSIVRNGYSYLPDAFSLEGYKAVFEKHNMIINAYSVTLTVTILGTFFSLLFCAMLGYMMSVRKVKYRNVIAMFMVIPMIFYAGLVPWYLVCTTVLHLKNTILAMILPLLINPFNVFLLRNYFKTIPASLAESAEIDGAGPLYTFIMIILPLAKPILATVGLFVSLGYWNDFVMALWLVDKPKLYPIQYFLYRVLSLITFTRSGKMSANQAVSMPAESMQMAVFVITLGPIVFVYPYLQKYFVKGIMIGAIKG